MRLVRLERAPAEKLAPALIFDFVSEKRQRTGAVQNLADWPAAPVLAKRLGLRWSSTATDRILSAMSSLEIINRASNSLFC